MLLMNPRRATKFFKAKLDFTTGPVELRNMIDDEENINIIDVRHPEDFEKGHIPNAINSYRALDPTYGALYRDRVNIIYCYSEECHLAAEAAMDFAEHGFSVMELEGGFDAWQKHDLPIEG
jgi:rhodanese-related sulfurtransferase